MTKQQETPQAVQRPVERLVMPWRCFHCDEIFHTKDTARDHFGWSESHVPACRIDAAEYRRMEEAVRQTFNEETELHKALFTKEAEMHTAVRRAEELGYSRGLADAKLHPEELGLREA